MYRVLVLTVFLAAASLADSEDMKKKCRRLGHPATMQCCKSGLKLPDEMPEDLKECMKIHKPYSCERDICVGKMRGYASDEGAVDKEAYMKSMSEAFKDSPAVIKGIKDTCVNGDLAKYGPPDVCEVMKLNHCVHRQIIINCNEWNDEGPCAGVKDLVNECIKMDN